MQVTEHEDWREWEVYPDCECVRCEGAKKAIDTGGGQTCDIKGVIRELNKYGCTIVARHALEALEKPAGALFTPARYPGSQK